jgi:hypothetical protein
MDVRYADVSRWALRTAGGRGRGGANSPKDPDAPERDPLPRSTAGSDVWHIAADRVEAVGPCAPRRPAEPRG